MPCHFQIFSFLHFLLRVSPPFDYYFFISPLSLFVFRRHSPRRLIFRRRRLRAAPLSMDDDY